MLVPSENSSAANKRDAKIDWPPAVCGGLIVFDGNVPLVQYTQGPVEVTTRANLVDKRCKALNKTQVSYFYLVTITIIYAGQRRGQCRCLQDVFEKPVRRSIRLLPVWNPALLVPGANTY